MVQPPPRPLSPLLGLVLGSLIVPLTARGGPSPTEVDEQTILRHAEQHAPQLALAHARLSLANAPRLRAEALLPEDPELSLAAGPRLGAEENTLDWEVSLSQRLELAGERGLRREASRRLQQLLRAGLRHARWRVHARVHRAFHMALLARRRLSLRDELTRSAGELLTVARKRQAAGDIAELQVSLVRGELSLAHQAQLVASERYRQACARLARLAGWPAGKPLAPRGQLEQPRPLQRAEQLLRRLVPRHPGLLARRAELRRAEAQLRLARRERVPKPSLGLSVGREAEGAAEAATLVVGTLSLPLPLWRRGRGEVARARAAVRLARAELTATRFQLESRLRAAVSQLNSAAQQNTLYGERVLPAFGRSLHLLQLAFAEGKVNATELLLARSRLLALQAQSLQAMERYVKARAALEQALGSEPPAGGAEEKAHD